MQLSQPFVIAVVDDDERILWSLESLLESADYSVRVFVSAGAFFESGCLQQIDCLISDIDMPCMDGFELLRTVRGARPELPTILVTGYPDRLKRMPAQGENASAVFTKPFHGPQLLAAVEDALRGARK